jgi:hypothetical protein
MGIIRETVFKCEQCGAEQELGKTLINSACSVSILGLNYQVVDVDVIERGQEICGQIDHLAQTIKLERKMTPERREQTIIHEIIHGILDQLGYLELHNDEQLVQGLSVALHQTFKPLIFS